MNYLNLLNQLINHQLNTILKNTMNIIEKDCVMIKENIHQSK